MCGVGIAVVAVAVVVVAVAASVSFAVVGVVVIIAAAVVVVDVATTAAGCFAKPCASSSGTTLVQFALSAVMFASLTECCATVP